MTNRRRISLRLEIEGIDVVFVSDASFVGLEADGRYAVSGLLVDGISTDVRTDPVRGELDASGFAARIIEERHKERIGKALGRESSKATWLSANVSTTDTRVYVVDNSLFSSGEYVHVGTECMKITAVGSDAAGDYFDVNRAQWGTTALAHYVSTGAEGTATPRLSDAPSVLEGRRAMLLMRSDEDITWRQVWRGVVEGDARLGSDGVTWEVQIGSLGAVLDGELGALGDALVRPSWTYLPGPPVIGAARGTSAHLYSGTGIASSVLPVWFVIEQHTGTDASTSVLGRTEPIGAWGWYSDPPSFAAALDSAISSAMTSAGMNGSIRFVMGPDGATLQYTPDSTTPRFVRVWASGGRTRMPVYDAPDEGEAPTELEVYSVAAAKSYVIAQWSARWPFGLLGTVLHDGWDGSESIVFRSADPTYPTGRVRLGGDTPIPDAAGELVEVQAGFMRSTRRWKAVRGIDSAAREVEIRLNGRDFAGAPRGVYSIAWSGGEGLALRLGPSLGRGSLADALERYFSQSPQYTTSGGMPLLTQADFESGSTTWSASKAEIEAAESRNPLLRDRWFGTVRDASLGEWLRAELRARGLMLSITPDGVLAIRRWSPPSEGAPVARSLDASDIVVTDSGYPSMERMALGSITSVRWKDGPRPTDSGVEHDIEVLVRDAVAYSEQRQQREMVVEMLSAPSEELASMLAAAPLVVELARPSLALLGRPYYIVEVDAGWPAENVSPGDLVSISAPSLVSPESGQRPLSRAGLVVGTRRDYDGAVCRLSVLVMGTPLWGYAPVMRIKTVASLGGTSWRLTVDSIDPWVGKDYSMGQKLSALFAAADKISIHAFDTGAGSSYTGVVDAVVPGGTSPTYGTIDVTLSASWTPGSSKWLLKFDSASAVEKGQEPWVYVATARALIPFSSGNVMARRYSP